MLTPAQEEQLGNDFSSDVVRTIDALADRINELTEKIEQLEAREQNLKYCGVWESGRQYMPGNFVTDRGSIWHANILTKERPGTAPTDWVLAVKRGADRKDAQ